MRSQSALDFLSTYSFMFLIIAIALAILLIYSSLPNTVFPLDCNMYNTFQCVDAILTNTTTPGQSQLLVVFADQAPGIINISSFTPTLDYKQAVSDICTPSLAEAGQRIYCVATFDTGAVPGRIYSGTLRLTGNYCASGVGNLSYSYCQANSNYSYGGFIRIEASTLPVNELPLSASNFSITVNNTQNSGAIPAHFDVAINFSPLDSRLATHERPDLGNIRFYYGGKELYSWCESSCSSSATSNAVFWVKIPQAIPPLSSKKNVMTLHMYLLPITTEYDGVYAGEAPQLNSTYAKYDNGANVFYYYNNFAGTSLPRGWLASDPSAVTVNDGVSISAGSVYTNTTIFPSLTKTAEMYAEYTSLNSGGYSGIMQSDSKAPQSNNAGGAAEIFWMTNSGTNTYTAWSADGTYASYNIQNSVASAFVPTINTFYTLGSFVTSNTVGETVNYANELTAAGSYNTTQFIILGDYAGSGAGSSAINPIRVQWVRVRAYPPSGVMPTVTIT